MSEHQTFPLLNLKTHPICLLTLSGLRQDAGTHCYASAGCWIKDKNLDLLSPDGTVQHKLPLESWDKYELAFSPCCWLALLHILDLSNSLAGLKLSLSCISLMPGHYLYIFTLLFVEPAKFKHACGSY